MYSTNCQDIELFSFIIFLDIFPQKSNHFVLLKIDFFFFFNLKTLSVVIAIYRTLTPEHSDSVRLGRDQELVPDTKEEREGPNPRLREKKSLDPTRFPQEIQAVIHIT